MKVTSLHEHMKNVYVEQFSLKSNQRRQKDSYTTKAVNKDPCGFKQEGKRSNQVGTFAPRRGLRGKREIT